MSKGCNRPITRSKWFVPLSALTFGTAALVTTWLGGHPGQGAIVLCGMVLFAAVILLAGRSETVRGLRGDGRDERFAQIDMRATAVTGLVLIVTLIAAWLGEIARGRSGSPYDWLCAISGLSYLIAVAFFRWRG